MTECALCLGKAGESKFLCQECVKSINHAQHACLHCALPTRQQEVCFQCNKQPQRFLDQAFCSYLFEPPLSGWIRLYKDQHALQWLPRLTWLLQNRPAPFINQGFDAVCFIPSPRRRLFWRGFNPAELLARKLAKWLQLPLLPHAIYRSTATDQRRLSRKARVRNSLLSFQSGNLDLSGMNILIVEDVITTGATSQVAAQILKQQGAALVCVWALAKVTKH